MIEQNGGKKVFDKLQKKYVIILFMIFSTCVLLFILFAKYLLGQRYWIFTGIASDSYNQVYPGYYHVAQRISDGINGNGWDFVKGYGMVINDSIIQTGMINGWLLFFGEENVAYLMSISYIAKIGLCVFLFYNYLRVMGRTRCTSFIFSLGYAFCGHMILRGRWEQMPRECLLVALLLLSFELYFVKNDIRLLPIAMCIFLKNSSIYYVILYGVIFVGYAFFRYFTVKRFELKEFILFWAKLAICAVVLVPFVLPHLESLFTTLASERTTEGVSELVSATSTNWILDIGYIQSAFFRTIGTTIIGAEAGEYSGAINVLADATFYCGLITLLTIPIAVGKNNVLKKRIWYLVGLTIAVIYFFVNPIRMIVAGMAGTYYFKTSSFWIIVLFLFIGSEGLDILLQRRTGTKEVMFMAVALITFAELLACFVNCEVNIFKLFMSIIFLLVYVVLLQQIVKAKENIVLLMKGILVLVSLGEVFFMSYSYVNTSKAITDIDARIGLNDYSIEAIEYVNERESDKYFRIDKQYESYGLNDSTYQNYMGTRYYVGGLGNSEKLKDFYSALALPHLSRSKLYAVSQSDEINTLLGVKYILSKNDFVSNYGYEQVDCFNGIYVYENQYAIPLIYGHKKCMCREDFEKLPVQERRDVMLEYCIIDDDVEREVEREVEDISGIQSNKTELIEANQIEYTEEGQGVCFSPNSEGEVIVLVINAINSREDDIVGKLTYYVDGQGKCTLDVGVPKGEHELIFTLACEGVNRIETNFGDGVSNDILAISNVSEEDYFASYMESVNSLKDIGLQDQLIDYAESTIYCTVTLEQPTEICFAIPFDEGWTLYVDNEETKIESVDIAFMGAYLKEGEHIIELKYEPQTGKNKDMILIIGYCLVAVFVILVTINMNLEKHNYFLK